MDVNQTKYHLLYGQADWGNCNIEGSDLPLAKMWEDNLHPALEWDNDSSSLRLTREVPLFRRAGQQQPLDLNTRRGSGRDQYGNWYWIDQTESGLRFLVNGARQSTKFWTAADRVEACVPEDSDTFVTCLPPLPPTLLLRGLAVTTRHFLVVGDVTEKGLLVFDLHHGGTPWLIQWPSNTNFVPWDIAPTRDGGVVVLDRENLKYWQLDSDFRVQAEVEQDQEIEFQPQMAELPRHIKRGAIHPQGFSLVNSSMQPLGISPVSIETGPDNHVLILDTSTQRAYSVIYEYQGSTLLQTYSLMDAIEVMDPNLGEGTSELFSVIGHDFAYVELPDATTITGSQPSKKAAGCGCGCGGNCQDNQPAKAPITTTEIKKPDPIIYVAERAGKQAIAFVLDREKNRLEPKPNFYPLRKWVGKALVNAGGQVYYDFADRWVPLEEFVECEYTGAAVLTTPLNFFSDVAGRPFDSDQPGCIWHRLMLDARIPAGTSVEVRARASDDLDLIEFVTWISQPNPYLRSGGAELPFYDPWKDNQDMPENTGTWELLFQGIKGRYLQLELTFQGTGRSTPLLRTLRAWYPRFSYSSHYLPAIYQEQPGPASFLERWLANFEGFYTNLEDKIEHVSELFDPRTAPADTLDWLGCWLGLVLDPLWPEDRRRFFIRNADKIYRLRGTLAGVEIALRLYLDPKPDDSLFDPRCWGSSKVRIVESFLTRLVGGRVYGDPSAGGANDIIYTVLTPAIVAAAAHRFTVLLPHELDADQQAMVDRIVNLEKPAHTEFELKLYWDLFRVGEARLGLDTQLGNSNYFNPMQLGAAYLADSYLPASYPFDVADRIILNRDRLGNLPRF